MKVRLLGPLEILDDGGHVVAIPGGRQRTLLALLALNPGRVTPADRLIDDLWGAAAPRMVLVPATMALLGNANWWLPRWLDRVLPHLDLEGGPTITTAAVPAGDEEEVLAA